MAGRPPAIARLVLAALPIALAPTALSARVHVAPLYTAGLRPLVIPAPTTPAPATFSLRDHQRDRRSRRRDSRSPPPRRRPISPPPPPQARTSSRRPTTLVADAVQTHAPDKAAHCPLGSCRLLHVGNGASGTGVRTRARAEARVRITGGRCKRPSSRSRSHTRSPSLHRCHHEGKGDVFEVQRSTLITAPMNAIRLSN